MGTEIGHVGYLRQMVSPFRGKGFSLLFLTTISASLGDMFMDVSSGWLVLELTDSPLSLGLFWAVRSSPNLLFGMVGGATADKMDRRKLLMICYILYAVCGLIFGFLIISGLIHASHLSWISSGEKTR